MNKAEVYEFTEEETLAFARTNINGLSDLEVEKRLLENGLNKLKESKHKNLISKFIDQIKNVMIIILLIAASVSFIVAKIEKSSVIESLVIFIVVILNAVLGVIQESKAEKAIEALKKMSAPYIKVKRNGNIQNIKTEELVLGDIVLIEAGDFVPADMRIIVNNSIRVEEAALTGESLPVDKMLGTVSANTSLGDRKNMLYSGSSVVYGRGEAVVIATGMNTELGKIAKILSNVKETLTPLQKKINEISRILSIVVVVVGLAMVVLGFLQGNPPLEIFMLSVSLAVAAIPEGLPTAITIILAIGVQKMSKQNAIIRKLASVETLGATEIICSDKTGTLTQNKMVVKEFFVKDKKIILEDNTDKLEIEQDTTFDMLLKAMVLCNDTKEIAEGEKYKYLGDPTETALVAFARDINISKDIYETKHPRVAEVPFDSDRKMMTTINKNEDETGFTIYTKGSIEAILGNCTKIYINKEEVPLTYEITEKILLANLEMSKKALRVLGFAYKKITKLPSVLNSTIVESELVYVGLVGLRDPPRPEVIGAIKESFLAGMTPIMITGDNIETASAIAREIGLLSDKDIAISGRQLDEMSDDEFKNKIKDIRVYARVSPENKVRIVSMWKELGKIVAMTGDGVNDAPALKTADIGIGMGITGTEVSKSVSSMILSDDNFATIVVAVKEGRRIYNNIQNVIVYLLASNIAEILIVFISTLFGSIILYPIQLLWINLVTDTIPAITLGFEPSDKNIMKEKPRKAHEKFFTAFLTKRIAYPAIVKSMLILSMYFIVEATARYNHIQAMTAAFITLTFAELFFVFTVRSDKKSILKLGIFTNPQLLVGIILTILLQCIVIFIPSIGSIFRLVPLDTRLYIASIGTAVLFGIFAEIIKLILARKHIN